MMCLRSNQLLYLTTAHVGLGMAIASPWLTGPSLFRLALVLATPAKMVGQGWGEILAPHHKAGWGRDEFKLFRSTLPHHHPA